MTHQERLYKALKSECEAEINEEFQIKEDDTI